MSHHRIGRQIVGREPVVSAEGAVATAREASAQAAARMLEEGGTAVDAAVAAACVAGVIEPMETTLAGSGFMLVARAGEEPCSIEFGPRAPKAATTGMFRIDETRTVDRGLGVSIVEGDLNAVGLTAAGVPAVVAGLSEAHRRFGRLPLPRVLEPAMALAHDGFPADAYFALEVLANLEPLRRDPVASSLFLTDGGPPVVAHLGHATLGAEPIVRQKLLGRTLERVAASGHDGFYAGKTAAALAATAREGGGLLSLADLSACRAHVTTPRRLRFGDVDVWAPRSPCGAVTQLQMLSVWQALHQPGAAPESQVERMRRLAEVGWHAFADRYHWLGDPDFVAVPEDGLLSKPYAAHIARLIEADDPPPRTRPDEAPPWEVFAGRAVHDPWAFQPGSVARASWSPGGATESPSGTTHVSIADREGTVVSLTFTAANHFGCKVVCPRTGLLMDAAMGWFNARPGAANSIAGGKRPLANMGPLLLTRDGTPFAALGAPGGRRIIYAVVQLVLSLVEERMDAADAVAAPRIDASGSTLLLAERLGDVAAELAARGLPVRIVPEQHEPFSYELARPVVVARTPTGAWMPSADPFTRACALVL